MTPKEKAKELFDKFHYQICNDNGMSENESNIMCAKQCAKLAVDEILNYDLKTKSEPQFVIERRLQEYWQEVRNEIEKL